MPIPKKPIVSISNPDFLKQCPILEGTTGNFRCRNKPLCDNKRAGNCGRDINAPEKVRGIRITLLERIADIKKHHVAADWDDLEEDVRLMVGDCLCKKHQYMIKEAEDATVLYLQEECGIYKQKKVETVAPSLDYHAASVKTSAVPHPPLPPPPSVSHVSGLNTPVSMPKAFVSSNTFSPANGLVAPSLSPSPPSAHTHTLNTPPTAPQPATHHAYQQTSGINPSVLPPASSHAYQAVNGTYSGPSLPAPNHTYQHVGGTNSNLLHPFVNQANQFFTSYDATFPPPAFNHAYQHFGGNGPNLLPPVHNNAYQYTHATNPSLLEPTTKHDAAPQPANINQLDGPSANSRSRDSFDRPSRHHSAQASQDSMRPKDEHAEPSPSLANKPSALPKTSDQDDRASDRASVYHTAPSSQVPVTSASPIICQRSDPLTCKLIHQFALYAPGDTRKKILDKYIDWSEEKARLVDDLDEENAELVEDNTELTKQNARLKEQVARLTEQLSAPGLQSSTDSPVSQPKRAPRGFGVRTRSATKAVQNAQQTQDKTSSKKVASYEADRRKQRASKSTPRPPIEELSDELEESEYVCSDSDSEYEEL